MNEELGTEEMTFMQKAKKYGAMALKYGAAVAITAGSCYLSYKMGYKAGTKSVDLKSPNNNPPRTNNSQPGRVPTGSMTSSSQSPRTSPTSPFNS